MAEKDWQKVLRAIYEENLILLRTSGAVDTSTIEEISGLGEEAVQNSLAFLTQAGLVGEIEIGKRAVVPRVSMDGFESTSESETIMYLGLTPDGFEVMHQRETNQTRHELNVALVVLTWGLFGAAMIQASLEQFSGKEQTLAVALTGTIVVLGAIGIGIIDRYFL